MAKTPRRVFDHSITLAVNRWECLRRNPDYKRRVQLWIDRDAEALKLPKGALQSCCLEKDGTVTPPFDLPVNQRYINDCERWGLKMLLDPEITITEDEMSIFPVFADTPGRQLQVRDRAKFRQRVKRLSDLGTGRRPGGAADLLEEMNREDQQRIERGEDPAEPDMSERDLRRYLHLKAIPEGPFQLSGARHHLQRLPLYLQVFDRRETRIPFAKITKELRISVPRAKRAYAVAVKLVRGGPEAVNLEEHISICPKCKRTYMPGLQHPSERPCRWMERYLKQVGVLPLRAARETSLPEARLDLAATRPKLNRRAPTNPSSETPPPSDEDKRLAAEIKARVKARHHA